MNVLDLFSGIGGFSLGLERAGMRTVAFCEIEPYCRAVLAKHWPDVPCYTDIRELTADRLAADGIQPDVICGGFPCQDISVAGKGAGLAGARSGLWSHYARLIGELRPRYVIVENVSALLNRGLAEILGELASFGYDAEWHCIPASYVGAPHRRDRIWIVAYPNGDELWIESGGRRRTNRTDSTLAAEYGEERAVANAERKRQSLTRNIQEYPSQNRNREADQPRGHGENVANADSQLCGHRHNAASDSVGIYQKSDEGGGHALPDSGDWDAEPDVGRVAHGVPARVDRLRSLGNAVVPQIPEIIGRAIMRAQHV